MNPLNEDDRDGLTPIATPTPATTSRRRRALGAGAVALLCAATLAACGGDDDSGSDTTATTGGGAAAQTTTEPSTEDGGETASGEDNGVADMTADEILAAAREAALGADSVHVDGEMGEIRLDLSMVKGEGAMGEIAQGANRFEIVAVGDRFFMKGDEEFYRQLGGEGIVQLLGDRWLEAPTTDPEFASLAQLSDMERLLGEMLNPTSGVTKGEETDVDGTPAIALRSGRTNGTLYVATEGEPFPLQLVGEGDRGQVVFEDWNEPVELEAPRDAVDISQLESTRGS